MNILYDCAIILLCTKLLGMLTRKLGLPQVVGMIVAGLLISLLAGLLLISLLMLIVFIFFHCQNLRCLSKFFGCVFSMLTV